MLANALSNLSPALVVKTDPRTGTDERYLHMTLLGQPEWVDNPEFATAFPSMREATRVAVRLPANLRAFSLPREAEVGLGRAH